MFTGLVEEVGKVESIQRIGGKRRLTVAAKNLTRELKSGDSIAVSGVCLTAVDIAPDHFAPIWPKRHGCARHSRASPKARWSTWNCR